MENIRVMISEEDVNKRIAEMGAQISEDYAGKEIHLIAILKGSVFFACELASLHLCTLLSKPDRREVEVPVRYIGFEVPDEFVVGYGLDYAQKYRNLPYIGVVEEE